MNTQELGKSEGGKGSTCWLLVRGEPPHVTVDEIVVMISCPMQARLARRAAQASAAADARTLFRRESEWIVRQPKARGTKSQVRGTMCMYIGTKIQVSSWRGLWLFWKGGQQLLVQGSDLYSTLLLIQGEHVPRTG